MSEIITYKNDPIAGVFSQIKLDSGERIMISFALTEVKIFKLKLGGFLPGGSIWEYDDLDKFTKLIKQNGYSDHPLDVLVDKAINSTSINNLKDNLDKFVAELEKST